MRETIYRDHVNGRYEYFTYSDGQKVYLSMQYAAREVARGLAELIIIK